MYLAYSFLQDEEWYRLSYPVRLDVRYKSAQLTDVLRGENLAPTLERIRHGAERALERANPPTHPQLTRSKPSVGRCLGET